jgi:alkylated DNA repair dioxygenase AlkB
MGESNAMPQQQSLFAAAPSPPAADHPPVPGLILVTDFLSAGEAAACQLLIDQEPWLDDLSRRVQHHGWRYDYKARSVARDMRLGPLPGWAAEMAARLHGAGHFDRPPDQVIVNEYLPGQGIAAHIDCSPCFGPVVATVSLGDAWVMDFTSPQGTSVAVQLPVGSVAILSGESRSRWRHGIAKRKGDLLPAGRRERSRRVSVTFRTVIVSP